VHVVSALRADTTRRELLLGAAALGAAGGTLLRAHDASAAPSDGDLLATLLGTEMLAAFVYVHTTHTAPLTIEAWRVVHRILGHERAHVRALRRLLDGLGGTPPPAVNSAAAADRLLAASGIPLSLGQLRTEPDYLRMLIHLEIVLERAYYEAISRIVDPELQRTAAEILAAEAQHQTVLVDLLFPGDTTKSVPESFVEGNAGDARV
jgi:Ferritin-like domain